MAVWRSKGTSGKNQFYSINSISSLNINSRQSGALFTKLNPDIDRILNLNLKLIADFILGLWINFHYYLGVVIPENFPTNVLTVARGSIILNCWKNINIFILEGNRTNFQGS